MIRESCQSRCDSQETKKKCFHCTRKTAWMGLIDDFVLCLFKIIIGYLTKSKALTASGIYSFHGMASTFATLIGRKVSAVPEDDEHPYGHGQVEYIITIFICLLVFISAVFVFIDAIMSFFSHHYAEPRYIVLVLALIAAFADKAFYSLYSCAYMKTNSIILKADSEHYKADAMASLAAAVGVLFGKFGFHFADSVIASLEAVHLIILSGELIYESALGLMDRAPDKIQLEKVRKAVFTFNDINLRSIRGRQVGNGIWIDIEIEFPLEKTINDASKICENIREFIINKFNFVNGVNVTF